MQCEILKTKSQFSEMANIPKSTVTGLVKKRFKDAMVGTRINVNHVSVREYLVKRQVVNCVVGFKDPVSGPAAEKAIKKKQTQTEMVEIPEDIRELAELSLRELVEKFGTDVKFLDWLKALKCIEDIQEKRIKNARHDKELVHFSLIENGVFRPLNTMFMLMLTDCCKTVSKRVKTIALGGGTCREIELLIQSYLQKHINRFKKEAERFLKSVEVD